MSCQGATLLKKKKKKKGKFLWWNLHPSSDSDVSTEKDRIKDFKKWCTQVGIELHPHVSTSLAMLP